MKKSFGIILIITTLCACKKVLDIQPTSSFTTDAVWTSPALVQVFVNEIYAESVFAFKDGGFGWGSQTDELYSNFNWCNENQYVQGQATPDNQGSSFPLNYSRTLNFWPTLYSTIQKCNTYFQNIGMLDTVGNQAQIVSMTGQVHFLRALCYFELLKRFGGVPLITKVYTTNDTKFTETRATWDSTEAFILSDISAALPGLQPAAPSGQEGTATTGAALALKSRLLLYAASPYFNTTNDMTRWQAAADAALAVINLNQYSLYGSSASYGKIFTDFFNPEVIFARVYGDVYEDRYNTVYRDLSPNGYNGYSAYNVLEQMVEAFQMNDGSAFSWSNATEAANPYQNRDPRFYADILFNGASFQGRAAQFWLGGLDSKLSSLSPWNASKTGYTILKMVDSTYNFNVEPYSAAQWIVFRLSEIYLNYAEAEAELGQTATALTYLNKIRERAGMPDVASGGGSDLIQKIQQERRIELCFEGHRFFDLRRWGMADQGAGDALGIIITPTNAQNTTFSYRVDTVQTRVWLPSFYYYPIPRSEIQANPNLTQNTGYN
ncbi:RagB/SusD family nutrient uptake outer membrane protein [Dinghuibacter silviterrae]|uniref:Putative outer membrane starch-binding protein n=1 Tax=Dinghuibacter silviterrae TaxID=1539049 RepID=A0A4V3GKR9_9BACT|nr:RagB/SusD family nutrient uptake outer membrane protein [Dinghuibacter silviterrae]TDW96672.1 putative outer membrane starch-binding protein [Dinghuibacter silviterrae]